MIVLHPKVVKAEIERRAGMSLHWEGLNMHLVLEMHEWDTEELVAFEERAALLEDSASSREDANIVAFREIFRCKYGHVYTGPRMGLRYQ